MICPATTDADTTFYADTGLADGQDYAYQVLAIGSGSTGSGQSSVPPSPPRPWTPPRQSSR